MTLNPFGLEYVWFETAVARACAHKATHIYTHSVATTMFILYDYFNNYYSLFKVSKYQVIIAKTLNVSSNYFIINRYIRKLMRLN